MNPLFTIIIKVGEKIRDVDPSNFMTQDTVSEVVKLVKELILP